MEVCFKNLQKGESSCSVQSLDLAVSQDSNIAEISHKGLGSPTQDPLDIHRGKPHGMQGNTGPYTKGVGTPLGQVRRIAVRVHVVNPTCKVTHEPLDCIGSYKSDTGEFSRPVNREGCGIRSQT